MTAELGGKTCVLVCEDCDVEGAVEGVLAAGFIASGQTCVTGSRVIVQEGVYEEVVGTLVRRTGELKVGRPWEGDTDIGAVIDGKAVERCQWFVDTAKKEGAKILVGGEATEVDGKVCLSCCGRLRLGTFLSANVVGRLSSETYICTA